MPFGFVAIGPFQCDKKRQAFGSGVVTLCFMSLAWHQTGVLHGTAATGLCSMQRQLCLGFFLFFSSS